MPLILNSGPPSTPIDRAWRVAYRLAFPLAVVWWRIRRRPHEGALVAISVGDDLLLVKSSYRRAWNLPGGGLEPGESALQAARRELREEIGLTAPETMAARIVTGVWDGRLDRVHIHELRLPNAPRLRLDHREIVAARLFSPAELASLRVTKAVAAYLRERPPSSSQ